jgi:hypothetical protein
VNPPRQIVGPAFVLDAQALSLLVDDDRQMTARLALATRDGFVSAISTVTIVEQRHDGGSGRLAWVRSRLTVVPVSEEIADVAANLLNATGLDGHDCVVDAVVVATAASATGPAKIASSDGSHIPALCGEAGVSRASPVTWVRV